MEEGKQEKGGPQRRGRGPRGPYQVSGTPKQLRYLAGLIAGKSKLRAAHDAGYKGCPRRAVADLDRAAFNLAIHEAMEAAGITLQYLMRKIRRGMEAQWEQPFLTYAGDIVYVSPAPDHAVRLKATQFAADLLGISSIARQPVKGETPSGAAVDVLLMAKQFEHLSDAELEDTMRLMQNRMTTTSTPSSNAIKAKQRDC